MKKDINEHLKDIIRQEIKNALAENKMQIGNGQYSIRAFEDLNGFAISFIPDSKTLDIPVNTQVNSINELLRKRLGEWSKAFYYQSGHQSAGRIYRLNANEFTDVLTKLLS
jgi:hypothetical protein